MKKKKSTFGDDLLLATKRNTLQTLISTFETRVNFRVISYIHLKDSLVTVNHQHSNPNRMESVSLFTVSQTTYMPITCQLQLVIHLILFIVHSFSLVNNQCGSSSPLSRTSVSTESVSDSSISPITIEIYPSIVSL